MKLLASAGGTGGHLFPAMSVIDELRRAGDMDDLLFVGRRTGIERDVALAAGIEYRGVTTAPWPTRLSYRFITSTVLNVVGVAENIRVMRSFKPDAVFTTGGYVSLPAAVAAGVTRTPLVIHEQNRYPGRANRLAAKFATRAALSTENVPQGFSAGRSMYVGTPVRRDLLVGLPGPAEARDRFGLDPDRFTLLVIGGSQGARSINMAVSDALDKLGPDEVQMIIAAGTRSFDEMSESCAHAAVRTVIRSFIDDMSGAYAAADLVVCRAGASTLAELAVTGRPSILVPYPHAAGGHQQENAERFESQRAARMIIDKDLTGDLLARTITEIARDTTVGTEMAKAASALAVPDAARRIADILRDVTEK